MKHLTVALALLTLTMLPSAGQEGDSETRIQIKTMEIPRYLPLAQQAGISGNVTLHLTVNKNGEVTVVASCGHETRREWRTKRACRPVTQS